MRDALNRSGFLIALPLLAELRSIAALNRSKMVFRWMMQVARGLSAICFGREAPNASNGSTLGDWPIAPQHCVRLRPRLEARCKT